MYFKQKLYIIISIFLLTGFQTEPGGEILPLIIPTKPQVWTVQVSDAAERVQETFNLCNDAIPGVSLLVEQSTPEEIITEPADFVFASDSLDMPESKVFLLYEESFNVVTHFEVPVYSLTMTQMQDIYTGRVTDWSNIDITSSYKGEIQRFGYFEGSDLQGAFEQTLGEDVVGKWHLVPDPEAMLDSIFKTPYAIGFLPEWAVGQSVNIVEIEDRELKLQIIVYSREESTASLNWLRCLHSELNP